MIQKLAKFAGIVAVVSLATAGPPHADRDVAAITRPSEDITLSSTLPVRVAKVLVKDGDTVKPGQTLVQLDDAAERIQLEQLKAQADDDTRIKAAIAQLDQKKLDLKRIVEARRKGVATELEEEHARLEVTISDLSLTLTRFEHAQNQRKHEEAKVRVDRLRLSVPASDKDKPGDTFKVRKVFVSRGESVDRLKEVIRIIKIDPLKIDVPVPMTVALALKLKTGQTAHVFFPDEKDKPNKGTITYVADEADAASATLTVRVEVPNPTESPAGQQVTVRFSKTTSPTTKPADKDSATTRPDKTQDSDKGAT